MTDRLHVLEAQCLKVINLMAENPQPTQCDLFAAEVAKRVIHREYTAIAQKRGLEVQ